MRILNATVGFGVTSNLGNFNSVKSSLDLQIEFREDEDLTAVITTLQELVKQEVYDEIASVKGPRKNNMPQSRRSIERHQEDLL